MKTHTGNIISIRGGTLTHGWGFIRRYSCYTQKLQTVLLHEPANSVLEYILKKNSKQGLKEIPIHSFTAALFATAKAWKQSKCPLRWMDRQDEVYTNNGIIQHWWTYLQARMETEMRTTGLWRQWGKRVGRIETALKYVQHHVWNTQPVGRCCSAQRVFSLVLYDDLERWGGKVAQEGVDVCIFMAVSCCTAETNTTL